MKVPVPLLAATLAVASAACAQPAPGAPEASLDPDRPTVLITGSNRGIGLGFATHYAESGWNVIATARNPTDASALRILADHSTNVSIEELDVLDATELESLSRKYSGVGIDLLINNAAFHGGSEDVGENWLAEAERRLKAYDEGATDARDIDDALSEIERQLR
jgi:NAD(P)-dependent dehydrogenase (short-subunit alcohol dehydrogenase family)